MKMHQWHWRLALAAVVLGSGMAGYRPAGAGAQPPRAPANSSFAAAVTLPASLPVRKVPGIGPTVPGSGPVIAADGSVYLTTSDGVLSVLSAFTPTGDLKWKKTA